MDSINNTKNKKEKGRYPQLPTRKHRLEDGTSNVDIAIAPNTCFAAEVGLSGEIRPVPRVDQRISEAEKMGFERIYISKYNKGISVSNYDIQVIQVGKIGEVLKSLFG